MTSQPSVDLAAPDITPYRAGNTGVEYVTTFDSGASGPHVMLSAVVHGNELCGAIALDFLMRNEIRPSAGKLTLAFMNVAAYQRFDPAQPGLSRFVDEDFNRVWTASVLDGPRRSVELERARQVRPIVDTVDLLLDIHSMQHPTVPLMMCGSLEKGRRLALAIGTPEHIVSDPGHAAGKRMRDYALFADPDSDRNSLLVECGQHWTADSADVAKDVVLRFLLHAGVVESAKVEAFVVRPLPSVQRVVDVTGPVTIGTDAFRFVADYRGMEVIREAGTLIGWDDDREVRTPYDDCVLIMPSRRLRKGESAVRFGRYLD